MNCFVIHLTLQICLPPPIIFFFLFPVLKDYLKERRYNDRSSLDSSIHQGLNSMTEDDFTAAIQRLPERWQKCVSAEGRYFEKVHLH